ncbi:target of Sbf [Emmonsiellopsis sp. PD_33]|nr:target of Sbf [Emmonsiellopsis sp. PD_33]KAK2798775.1 target of Sbf [Onygenales sp. PD_10]
MRGPLAVGAVLAASLSTVSAQACAAGTAQQIGGNWYCSAVDSITYTNFGSSGTYNEVTSMGGGSCSSKAKEYSGPLAPLNEEVSWHFRGPLSLKKFAYYTPGSSSKKREVKPSIHERRHGHQHLHKRQDTKEEGKRAVGDIVTATIDGQVVTWVNEYDGGAGPTPAPELPKNDYKAPKKGSQTTTARRSTPSFNAGAGSWGRQAFYDAEGGEADGLTFLNHNGGSGSGVFDYEFGNSLSYSSPDGCAGADSPKVLANKLIPDNKEVIIMSDKKCKGGDCGTVRPGTVAYHGFGGNNKIFLVELSMPLTGKTGWNEDMPAAWILNAAIPRTLQYGKAECSCWSTGCGELDVLEILDAGNTRAKSTLHGGVSGGDSNYFKRPSDGAKKYAVVFNGDESTAHIKTLPDNFDFSTTLSDAAIDDILSDGASASTFALGS